MSSIYFEKGKAALVNAPSRKRCYRCWWRSRHEGFSCAYALENDDTVLGTMKRLKLPDGAPCPCFLADKQVKVKSSLEKSMEEDVRFSAAKKSKKEQEAEKRRADTERKRAAREKARMDLYNEGYSDQEIAARLGCAPDTIADWRKRNHLLAHYSRGGHPMSEKARELMEQRGMGTHGERMALYREGYSDQEIADKLGCARGTIVSWRMRNELPCHYNEGGRPVTEAAKARVANRK